MGKSWRLATALFMASLWALSAFAADSPGTFVFSPETDMKTYNNWAEAGYELKQIRIDDDGDGKIDSVNHFTFSDSGRLMKIEVDSDFDSYIERVEEYQYNADGRVNRVSVDEDNDDQIDSKIEYVFNTDGTIKEEKHLDADNNIEETITFTYDDGWLSKKETDAEGDGSADSRYTYQDGFWITTEIDSDHSGEYDILQTCQYNSTGNLQAIAVDSDNNGSTDYTIEFSYDDKGRLESQKIEGDQEGEYDETRTYIWDLADTPSPGVFVLSPLTSEITYNNWAQNGYALKQIRTDTTNDGSADTVNHYTFNAYDLLTKLEVDQNNDGKINSRDKYVYNGDGNIKRVDIDSDADGNTDAVVRYYFHGDGSIEHQEIDYGNDGKDIEFIYFSYDDNGRLIKKETDSDGDGHINGSNEYFYDGDGFWIGTIKLEFEYDEDKQQQNEVGCSQSNYVYYGSTPAKLAGNLAMIQVDSDCDGGIDYPKGFFYDDQGRLENQKVDYNNDGTYEVVNTYIWDLADVPAEENDADSSGSSPSASGCFLRSLVE